MKLLEYEAKALLTNYSIPIPKGAVVKNNDSGSMLNTPIVLKSQIPTGERGKLGGIKIVEDSRDLASTIAELFTRQIKGLTPKTLLAEEKLAIQHEYYLSLIINKSAAEIQLLAHKNGGVEVEENDPKTFLTIPLDDKSAAPAGEQLAEYFDLPGQSFALQDMVENLYKCFTQNDVILLEINPLVYTTDNKLVAGDCKMTLDDAAAFRHSDWQFEEQLINTNFVTLNPTGSVATIANGAGLAMATVDAVTDAGMVPANFLDIGGGANSASVLAAFQKIAEYQNVKAIVINIFAGITKCDEVAKAIIEAKKHIDNLPALYIRLSGTNVELAEELLDKYQIPLLPTLEACLAAAKQRVNHE